MLVIGLVGLKSSGSIYYLLYRLVALVERNFGPSISALYGMVRTWLTSVYIASLWALKAGQSSARD